MENVAQSKCHHCPALAGQQHAIACRGAAAERRGEEPVTAFEFQGQRYTDPGELVRAVVSVDGPRTVTMIREPQESETRVRTLDDGRQAYEDQQEALARANVVCIILERCKEELARLEVVPHLGAEEVNALSAAKGFAARAEAALKSGLGL